MHCRSAEAASSGKRAATTAYWSDLGQTQPCDKLVGHGAAVRFWPTVCGLPVNKRWLGVSDIISVNQFSYSC